MPRRRRRALARRPNPAPIVAYEAPAGGVTGWMGEHPFLSFFIALSAISGIVTIVRGFPNPPHTP